MLTVLRQTKSRVSFPLGDEHFVNGHHVIRKSHDAKQKMSSNGTFQSVPYDRLKQTGGIKKVTLRAVKIPHYWE